MIKSIPPPLVLILGASLIPFLKGKVKSVYMLALPLLAFAVISGLPEGKHWVFRFMDQELILGRVDRLSLIFGYIFAIAAFIGILFALNVDDDLQHVSALVYGGSALGVAFAGDLFSLYVFWEFMAVSSTFLILARRTKSSQKAALRYVLVHVFGGLCLLAGIVMTVHQTGSIAFGPMELDGLGAYFIFAGIAVNAAIFPIHPWLKDAYPEATVTGTVFLSAFTTKSAVYLMARIFLGAHLLVWLGAIMAVIPIIYAAVENDIRRVIAYSLINQGGFMICGIGIGTPMAVNGAVSHAFCCVLYTALLFMATGSVLKMTGKIKCTDLGGLYKSMPITCFFCLIGAASISALPLFPGFVSKSMVISAVSHEKLPVIWFFLQVASACACFHAGVKVPFFVFFGEGQRDIAATEQEPPLNMRVAMGITAFLCIFFAFPGFYTILYRMLPYPVNYVPYTAAHVVGQLQVVLFGAFVFFLFVFAGRYPLATHAIVLDTDWFYIKGGQLFFSAMDRSLNRINSLCENIFVRNFTRFLSDLFRNAPARLALLAWIPLWYITGATRSHADRMKKNVYTIVETGSIPLGISAAVATLWIVVIYLLS